MSTSSATPDTFFNDALDTVRHTLARVRGCDEKEREILQNDVTQLQEMEKKLTRGQVEIVVFGEISTGKSALINALMGEAVADVDVQGGWTKEVWKVAWNGCGYRVPGLEDSQVILVDTPGLNEVGGSDRTLMAREAAQRADLILFVTDSDLNDTEYSALAELASINKPIVVVLNKIDLYSTEQRERLMEVLSGERLPHVIDAANIIQCAADPREVEYVVETADGKMRNEWRKPDPDVTALKARILELLDKEGLALLALNAAMYAADKSDRVAAVRTRLRNAAANKVVWSYVLVKAVAVAGNPVPVVDTLGGAGADAAMVFHLGKVYGLQHWSWRHAVELSKSIGASVLGVTGMEFMTHLLVWGAKTLSLGWATPYTAVPQAMAAGWGSYIVGQAARVYFEQGASWGGRSPKPVIAKILENTDKESVLSRLREEIENRLRRNIHADGAGDKVTR